jgi:hypothetical protein
VRNSKFQNASDGIVFTVSVTRLQCFTFKSFEINSDTELSLQNKFAYVYTGYVNLVLKRTSLFHNSR